MKPWYFDSFYNIDYDSLTTGDEIYVLLLQKISTKDVPAFLDFDLKHSGLLMKTLYAMMVASSRLPDDKCHACLQWLKTQDCDHYLQCEILENFIQSYERTNKHLAVKASHELLELVCKFRDDNVCFHSLIELEWKEKSLDYFEAHAILKKMEHSNYDKAHVNHALMLLDRADKNIEIFTIYEDLVRYLNHERYYDEALIVAKAAVSKLRQKFGNEMVMELLHWIGLLAEVFMDNNDYPSAMILWEEILSYKNDFVDFDLALEARYVWRLGIGNLLGGDMKKTRKYGRRGLEIASEAQRALEDPSMVMYFEMFARTNSKKQVERFRKFHLKKVKLTKKEMNGKEAKIIKRMGKNIKKGKFCVVCNRQSVKLMKCCVDTELYCSRDCQKEHWKTHKKKCLRKNK